LGSHILRHLVRNLAEFVGSAVGTHAGRVQPGSGCDGVVVVIVTGKLEVWIPNLSTGVRAGLVDIGSLTIKIELTWVLAVLQANDGLIESNFKKDMIT
jgi:hypothetical protein